MKTARRALGAGPQAAARIRAAEADLLNSLPGINLPDLDELRVQDVLGAQPPTPKPRRVLGAGGR
ncbi:hypothetical protein [Streptomyces sp. CB02959]|uniref:hypothetical protein n=1 Tax=Streptomyces sp. CB02959 TaxID=2020330 RepID=UPI0011AF93AD|nr:hypothetical protein [Streptomyces sp. CB02959]